MVPVQCAESPPWTRCRDHEMKNTLSGLGWVVLYLLFCLVPLVLAAGQSRPPGRPFLVEFSVALGFVGLSILALQFALIARFKVVAVPFGIDALLRYRAGRPRRVQVRPRAVRMDRRGPVAVRHHPAPLLILLRRRHSTRRTSRHDHQSGRRFH